MVPIANFHHVCVLRQPVVVNAACAAIVFILSSLTVPVCQLTMADLASTLALHLLASSRLLQK